MKPQKSCYGWWVWDGFDILSSFLVTPIVHTFSLGLSCYYVTTFDSQSPRKLLIRYAILGPLLLFISLLLLPFAMIGYLIWIGLCSFCTKQPFQYIEPKDHPSLNLVHKCPSEFTICTANVILIPEILVRYNNNRNVYWRVHEIAKRLILHQTPSLNVMRNLQEPVQREDIIQSRLPDTDVIMLQEVIERLRAKQLYKRFCKKYPYCLYDVGEHSLKNNGCFLGSGLFIASRFPIVEASFHPFSYSTKYAKFVGYGILLAKLKLGMKSTVGGLRQAVGYIGNIHTQAYQGKDQVIMHQLNEARNWMDKFVKETHNPEKEVRMFVIIGGDLNSDNMSPGDAAVQNMPLWDEYEDPCREGPGREKPWAIGTEHRQRMLHHPLVQYPETFRDILLDDVQRRHFILDAIVEEQTPDLMYVAPKPDEDGVFRAKDYGGRRRIDQLLVRRDSQMSPTSMWFSSSLAGLSDHVPVAFMLEEKDNTKDNLPK